MTTPWKPVRAVTMSVLALWALAEATGPAPASAQRLVVAGSPPTHEATLPHQGSISQKLPTRVMFEYLTDVDPATWDYERPMLAERWQMSPDARTWTFFLRKGVQFHENWGEMTAEDVKFSFELLMGKDAIATTTPQWRKNIERMDVVDRHTFRLVLKTPDPDVDRKSVV